MAKNNLAVREMRRGLPVALSISIDDALRFLASGRAEKARKSLEDALLYACSINSSVDYYVGTANVRGGKAFAAGGEAE